MGFLFLAKCTWKVVIGFSFALGILSLLSCTKDEDDLIENCISKCITIEGFITGGTDVEPLSDLRVEVTWANWGKDLSITKRKKAVGFTDEEGFYTLTFTVREDEETNGAYTGRIHGASGYFYCNGETPTIGSIWKQRHGETIERNYHFNERASVNINAEGISEMTSNGPFYLSINSRNESRQSCYKLLTWSKNNSNQEFSIGIPSNVRIELQVFTVEDNTAQVISKHSIELEKDETNSFTAVFE